MSGIWESARHGVPVWPGMPAGTPSPTTNYVAPALGSYQTVIDGSKVVGAARAIPYILDRPRKIKSVGVCTEGVASTAPGDTWEFGIYNDNGDTLLWSSIINSAGLDTVTYYSASVEMELPQRFIVTIGLTVSNGARYYAKNKGGVTPPGWSVDSTPHGGIGGVPIQGPTGLPSDLSAFGAATVNGVKIYNNSVTPIVRVYS